MVVNTNLLFFCIKNNMYDSAGEVWAIFHSILSIFVDILTK